MSRFPSRARALLVLCLALVVVHAQAANEPTPFIGGDDLPLFHYLAPPPADDSPQTRAEVAELLAIQASRTSEMVANANADVEQTVWRFADALPPAQRARFTAEALPSLGPFFQRLRFTKTAVVNATKAYWKRPRPYVLNTDVKPSLPLETTDSYPSGHSTVATLMAVVLSDMLPEYRPAIFARASAYAENRVTGGVHYRSDIVAGRTAGALLAIELQRNPEFVDAYRRNRDEVRRVLAP